MALKKITQNPTITDAVLFDILTPTPIPSTVDTACYESDPYKVDNIEVYFLEKSFTSENFGEYVVEYADSTDAGLQSQFDAAQAAACASPTEDNLRVLSTLQQEIDLRTKKQTIYYNNAKLVALFGTDDFPAWLSDDINNALISHIDEDANGATQYGHFELIWEPKGMREGNYFICWTWTPIAAGDSFTAHEFFTLAGDTQLTTSIPTHRTYAQKYEILQDRYLPDMFKSLISDGDQTPYILRGLNNAIADGFTVLEDMANQMVDVIDSNATHEDYLMPLANLFNLKLRSSDPTLWRRQIKRAIPVFKKKGTLAGLQEALAQTGVDLIKFTRLWQIISSYTWQEHFVVEDPDVLTFTLSKLAVLPIDLDNFNLYYRGAEDSTWTELTSDYVQLENTDGVTYMTWVGHNLSIDPVVLEADDFVRVLYKINEVPSGAEQTIEDYVRALPLLDLRDERDQVYPPKNWNVRALEEDDAFFDILIPTRHPYHDPLIWGWIRTEFPYSENIYNMEEYNGSTRESLIPCDIDRTFLDLCKNGQSSSYAIDLNVTGLSNDRLIEVQEILQEYLPFHAVLHSLNLGGQFEDFVQARDTFDAYVHIKGEDVVIAGNGQRIFNRVMTQGPEARRDVLADMATVASGSGTGVNSRILIYAPLINFEEIGLNPGNNVLQIRSGSNAGDYVVSNTDFHHAEIAGVVEPFSASEFTFRLSNELFTTVTTDIYQDDVFKLTDSTITFANYDIKTLWDVEQTPSLTQWTIQVTSPVTGTFDIVNILPDGSLILADDTHILPTSTTSDVQYNLLDETSAVIASGTSGVITVKRRGRVDVSGLAVDDIRPAISTDNRYLKYSTTEYYISGLVKNETHQFYIDNYTGGDRVGITTDIYQRLVNDATGYLYYDGMVLTTTTDYESSFGVVNGANAPVDPNLVTDNDLFKECYLALIGTDYYAISEWDGTDMYLAGPPLSWGVAIGTNVDFTIYHFTKNSWSVWEKHTASFSDGGEVVIPGHDFDFIDRRGNEIIKVETETATPMAYTLAAALNATKKRNNEMVDSVGLKEAISYQIEYRE